VGLGGTEQASLVAWQEWAGQGGCAGKRHARFTFPLPVYMEKIPCRVLRGGRQLETKQNKKNP